MEKETKTTKLISFSCKQLLMVSVSAVLCACVCVFITQSLVRVVIMCMRLLRCSAVRVLLEQWGQWGQWKQLDITI